MYSVRRIFWLSFSSSLTYSYFQHSKLKIVKLWIPVHAAICPFSIIDHTWRQNAVSKKKFRTRAIAEYVTDLELLKSFSEQTYVCPLKHYNEVPIKIRVRCSLHKNCFLLVILIWWFLYSYSQEFRWPRLDTTIKFLILSFVCNTKKL